MREPVLPAEAPTRDRILDAAERLFAERGGPDGASMRDLAAAAGVRLSLVSYHFGTKEALYRAVFARRAGELARAREAELAEALARPRPAAVDVMRACVAPSVRQRFAGGAQGAAFARLTAHTAVDPRGAALSVQVEHFDPTAERFMEALTRLHPGAGRRAVAEAYLFAIGALMMTMAAGDRLARLGGPGARDAAAAEGGAEGGADPEALAERLAAFCGAGAEALLGRRGLPPRPARVTGGDG